MKSAESFLAELALRRNLAVADSIPAPAFPLTSAALPAEIRRAASRGWRIFRVDPTSRFAPAAALAARIAYATSDCDRLETEFGEHPASNFAVATGPESGILALEVVSGYAGLAARAGAAILDGEGDSPGWRTLVSEAGGRLFAFFNYPAGLRSRICKQLAPGLTLHGSGGWVLIPPSIHGSGITHFYTNPDQPVSDPPAFLIRQADCTFSRTLHPQRNHFQLPKSAQVQPCPGVRRPEVRRRL